MTLLQLFNARLFHEDFGRARTLLEMNYIYSGVGIQRLVRAETIVRALTGKAIS